jgi:hypothetical protein
VVDSPAPGAQRSAGGSLSRRSLMTLGVAGVAGLVLSGCSSDNPLSDDKEPKRSTELAPDVAVATTALAEIKILSSAVATTAKRFPATRPQLNGLTRLHRAHEASLADAVPKGADTSGSSTAPAPYVVPRQRDAALRSLRAREQQLHDTLDGLALRAQSGEFARLLASMGAGIGQRLAVLAP